MTSPSLDDLLARDYPLTLSRRQGRFVCGSADLAIVADGSTADEAYEAFRAEQTRLFQRHLQFGSATTLPMPGSAGAVRPTAECVGGLRQLAAKAALLLLLGWLSVFAAGALVAGVAAMTLPKVAAAASSGVKTGVASFARGLDAITPEDREKYRSYMRSIGRNLAPFVQDLQGETCSAAAPQAR